MTGRATDIKGQAVQPDPAWIYDLYLLGQQVATAEDASRVPEQLLDHIISGFGAVSGSLAESNEDMTSLTIIAGNELPPHVIGTCIPFGTGIMGWVAEQGRPLLLNGELSSDPEFSDRLTKRETAAPSSAMCWPLIVENGVVGVISVNRREHEVPFNGRDLERGAGIVRFIAVAVENSRLHSRSAALVEEQKALISKLEEAHNQLLQSEKMASLGQLAAGVAHEINNPVGYISSNLGALRRYVRDVFTLFDAYEEAESFLEKSPDLHARIQQIKQKVDVDYLKQDLHALMEESQEGVNRVKQIVQDLKDFSHVDEAEWQWADLHEGMDSTLNIVHNEIKYNAEVVKEYGDLPLIECMPRQLNQVFMNILVNAAHAIDKHGTITVRTGVHGDSEVWVEISDTGTGIAPEDLHKIFEPFYTKKPVGKGTGLGLSLSYSIVERHNGRIEVESEPGKGTTFRVWLPVEQQGQADAAEG